MTNEFKAGYIAGRDDSRELSLDDKTLDFIAGYTQFKRDESNLAGNEDTDSFDH